MGVIFGGLMVGFLDQNTVIISDPNGSFGGKKDVPDTDVGDISGIIRPKSEVKQVQSRKFART
jgi:hypothetical protein